MPPSSPPHSMPYLRVVTQRLAQQPPEKLYIIVPALIPSITECKQTFAESQHDSDSAMLVHKFKTQLSAFLQDKNPLARVSAVNLIRAAVEVGGWTILQHVGPWVKRILTILGNRESSAVQTLCIDVLRRIFLLTQDHQSLIRETTTPSLPTFIHLCEELAKSAVPSQENGLPTYQNPVLQCSLEAFAELMPLHPTVFRPFGSRIKAMVTPLLAPTPSNTKLATLPVIVPEPLSDVARKLYCLLPVCSSKTHASDDWHSSLQGAVSSADNTAFRVLRVNFDEKTSRSEQDSLNHLAINETVSDRSPRPLGLPGWVGIYSGLERLNGLLLIIHTFVSSTTHFAVRLPSKSIVELLERLLSAPSPNKLRARPIRPEIERDEREGLAVALPQIQASSLGILKCIMMRLHASETILARLSLDLVLRIVEYEHTESRTRKAAYGFLSHTLTKFGSALPRASVLAMNQCIVRCCQDVLPDFTPAQDRKSLAMKDSTKPKTNSLLTNAESYLKPNESTVDQTVSADTAHAARGLLQLSLDNLPPDTLPAAVRTRIDRTMILTGHDDGMLASVTNPGLSSNGQQLASSNIAFLARSAPGRPDVEALLRPQMPMVQMSDTRANESPYLDGMETSPSRNSFNPAVGDDQSPAFGADLPQPINEPIALKRRQEEDSPILGSKRLRLASPEAVQSPVEQPAPAGIAAIDIAVSGDVSAEPAVAGATDVTEGGLEEPGDSDESDFVMPKFYLDPSDEDK